MFRRTINFSLWRNDDEEPMDTSDSPWCWYYLADCGRWHKLEDDPDSKLRSEDIEQYYLRNSRGTLTLSDCHSKIDFSAMSQTDLRTGRMRRIQRSFNIMRSCSCLNTAPIFWEKVDPTCPYQLIPLSPFSPEYETVAKYVKTDGLLDRPLLSIFRIQNLDLWELYCSKKKHLMRIRGVKEIQERRLFHGTAIKNVDTICKYNFDLRLSGEHGHAYGKGIYFAKHATYADKYSPSSGGTQHQHGESTKIIFLARLMIGTPIVGQSEFQKPDHGQLENVHDSCVNRIDDPTIFVIFDPNQIYPEYLIHYK